MQVVENDNTQMKKWCKLVRGVLEKCLNKRLQNNVIFLLIQAVLLWC